MAGACRSHQVACFTPLKAYRAVGGGVVFSPREAIPAAHLELPCGQCQGCRVERSRQWALRCVHEAQMHPHNSFITLTYRPKDLPSNGSLDVSHWQRFAKRLRKNVGPFRFLMCGEYGSENGRPHYHACLFGLDFHADRQVLRKTQRHTLWSSPTLDANWRLGHASIGSLTFQSAAYVARYVMKKVTGKAAADHYTQVDPNTGECWDRKPEFVTMSRRPGLGTSWFENFKSDVYPADEVVHDGQRFRPPRFYDNMLPEPTLEELKERRRKQAAKHAEDLTPERLRARETVAAARLSRLRRNI